MSADAACPELSPTSPPFVIQNEDETQSHFQLGLFESLTLPHEAGCVAYTGGPTWAVSWHPDGEHLAVSAHRAVQPVHRVAGSYSGHAHVQIWRMHEEVLRLVALAPHNGDTCWDLAWRPTTPEHPIHTLAAALADGQLALFHFFAHAGLHAGHEYVALRKDFSLPDGVRATCWSSDGMRLASGTLGGRIEVWLAREHSAPDVPPNLVLISCVRVHDFAVARICWFSNYVHGSVGHDGAVRLRDVRSPMFDQEYVLDGLAWNMCLASVEEDTVIAGTDQGNLKIAKLASLGDAHKTTFKKKKVQKGSIRDLTHIQLSSNRTALFAAGSEGAVYCGLMPRPLWTTKGDKSTCNSGRYVQVPILKWSTLAWTEEPPSLEHLSIQAVGSQSSRRISAPIGSDEKVQVDSSDLYCRRRTPLLLQLENSLKDRDIERMLARTAAKVRINVPKDVHLCASEYDQRTLIPRLAFAENTRLLAVPTHSGLLSVIHVTDMMLRMDRPGAGAAATNNSKRRKPAQPKTTGPVKVKKKKPKDPLKPKKRGRPRKYPYPESVREARCIVESIICDVLDEPFNESMVIAPRRGNLQAQVVRAHKPTARRSRTVKLTIPLNLGAHNKMREDLQRTGSNIARSLVDEMVNVATGTVAENDMDHEEVELMSVEERNVQVADELNSDRKRRRGRPRIVHDESSVEEDDDILDLLKDHGDYEDIAQDSDDGSPKPKRRRRETVRPLDMGDAEFSTPLRLRLRPPRNTLLRLPLKRESAAR